MQKLLILLCLLVLAACNPEPANQEPDIAEQPAQAGATIGAPPSAGTTQSNPSNMAQAQNPDTRGGTKDLVDQSSQPSELQIAFNNDVRTQKLIQLISADWELITANYKKLSIGNNALKFFEGSQEVANQQYVVSLDCSKNECLQDGNKPIGWCLTTGSECYVVTKATINALELYRSSDNEAFKYIRSTSTN